MVSIIICTYNRAEILKLCLNSIITYSGKYVIDIEVVIVDNNSTDHTALIVKEYESKLPIKCVFESNQGLSIARNTGGKNAKHPWLFYLDDDGLITETTFEVLFNIISTKDVKFFGGLYKAYYLSPKPKWLSNSFGNMAFKESNNEKNYISGGIMVLHKSIFIELNGFNSSLGMNGKKIGYGEETDLQLRIESAGYSTKVYEEFWIYHIVGSHKYKTIWHLKSNYYLGFYGLLSERQNYFKSIFIVFPIQFYHALKNLILKKDYYFENFILDSFNNVLCVLGFMMAKIKRLYGF